MRVVTHLRLLLWKNLVVTQFYHHYLITTTELTLPILLWYAYSSVSFDFTDTLPPNADGSTKHKLHEAISGEFTGHGQAYWSVYLV